jgi:hypothetical protein
MDTINRVHFDSEQSQALGAKASYPALRSQENKNGRHQSRADADNG